MAKCLLHEHENVSLTLSTHVNSNGTRAVVGTCQSALGKWRMVALTVPNENPASFLSHQGSENIKENEEERPEEAEQWEAAAGECFGGSDEEDT